MYCWKRREVTLWIRCQWRKKNDNGEKNRNIKRIVFSWYFAVFAFFTERRKDLNGFSFIAGPKLGDYFPEDSQTFSNLNKKIRKMSKHFQMRVLRISGYFQKLVEVFRFQFRINSEFWTKLQATSWKSGFDSQKTANNSQNLWKYFPSSDPASEKTAT